MNTKKYLKWTLDQFSQAQVKEIAKYSDQYVLDSRDILYLLAAATQGRPRGKESELRLVPTDLHSDMLHYAHEDFQGGHQDITRTYEKLRSEFYWPRMYADVEVFVKECTGCASAKGRPLRAGPSLGNIDLSRPFEVVSMKFVTLSKPMSSTTAPDVAEAYEEWVFRQVGASSMLRHDQRRATLAYRPQANGQQEHSVQTVIGIVRAYVAKSDHSDWDEHAERLMFALNTLFDATRLDTPFFLARGWDAQGTL
ncbi:hypothetical protein ON010_g18627 [Phytophthora cinnamomi]|nr:hypothetical protein ON010_g18627 [Phytophthora cinnamomi]